MMPYPLTDDQLTLLEFPLQSKVFLEGPAGAGKTTGGVARLLHLLDSGVSARSILVMVPQRTLGTPYYETLRRPTVRPGGQVTISTMGGLAQRMVDLFWPLIAAEAGFAHPEQPPTFLTLETAQYYMARLVRPLLDQGYFETVTIDRNRLYSQILDNLNKAAVVGFDHTEIAQRLKDAWGGYTAARTQPAEETQERIYDEAQACANRFRGYCLAHNLLDFSLQLEVFLDHLWPFDLCRDYLIETYQHLIVDNVEEDTPVAHDVLREWLPHCRSALVIYDQEAGYRRFLGADPESGRALRALCDEHLFFGESHVTSSAVSAFGHQLARSVNRLKPQPSEEMRKGLVYEHHRYHPQMIDWVAEEIATLVRQRDVPPGEIVVLAPFLSGSLRFALSNGLSQYDIPTRSHRPSRALRDEPATHCLLTLASLAHPSWQICPTTFDVAYALMQAIEGMDLVRAQLLAQIVYRIRDGAPTLTSFERIKLDMKERLTYLLGERYEGLRIWIEEYMNSDPTPLDHFLSRLFGEVLSQAGYGFHRNYDLGEIAANLIESVRKFRWVTRDNPAQDKTLGQEYVEMVQDGVIAAQYIRSWQIEPEDAVLLAPAYTFLMRNRPVDYQFWLDVGGSGWWERLYQPLTHPYVLSRHWPRDAVWTDSDEFEARQEALHHLTLGLIRRCRHRIYLGLSELDEHGNEQKGPLLWSIQRILRHLPPES